MSWLVLFSDWRRMVGCAIILNIIFIMLTFSGLAKVAIFTTNVDAENQYLINRKCVCGALNCNFCQTRVIGRFYLCH